MTRHRDASLGELGRLDYAASTIEPHSRTIGLFCEQVTERRLDAAEIDEAVLAELQDAVPTLRSAKGQRGRQGCIARFIAHLIDTGVIAPPTPPAPPAPGSLEHLRATYGDWLRHQQGLGQTTIKKRQAFLRRFMTFHFGAALGQLNDITADDILSFLDAPPMKTGGSGRGDGATHLRSLFRFLYATRRIRKNLIPLGVPRISAARARGLSRHMPTVEVRKLIDAIHDDDGRGRRNYAMLLMMARLGLRAEEVVAIRLDDINWPASEFLVRGKGGQHDRMPLLPDVGEAIVAYALDGRAGTSRHLFVTGMRIGEAIGLDDGDVDVDAAVLHVRHAKNGKDRFVPVTDCTNRYLGEYRAARDRILGSSTTAAFFAGENGRRLRLLAAQHDFARVGQKIGLRQKQIGNYHGLGPRLHDLRHSCATSPYPLAAKIPLTYLFYVIFSPSPCCANLRAHHSVIIAEPDCGQLGA